MYILTRNTSTELVIKGSRFIAEVLPVETQQEARDALKAQKTRYADATHVCHCFITGLKAETMGMSDDGEPSGTAGRPMLDVLKGRNITNLLLTVTRYFGGTLLGTGGLVKAYGDSAKTVLEKVFAENLAEEYVEKTTFTFNCSYDHYDKIKRLLDSLEIEITKQDFTSDITIEGKLLSCRFNEMAAQIKEMTNGKTVVERL